MELTFISIFAGCGGSSLGYKRAGFNELLAIDFDKNAIETFKLNFSCPIWYRDITQVSSDEILTFCNLKKGELDLLDGSPPCQGFSTSGKRQISDDRNTLFNDFIRLINELQPKVFVIENVSGMIKGKMKGMFIDIMKNLKQLNYQVKCKLMNAKYYDVPQSRQRVIFIGIRNDLEIKPSYPISNNKIITVKQALDNCPIDEEKKSPKGKMCKYVLKTKIGECASKYHPLGHYFNTKRNRLNRESYTIEKTFREGQSGILHPLKNRYHTISEIKRLCSFPDDFKLTGKFEEKWARLGNAVMPKFMEAIAKHIKKEVFEKRT